MAARKDNAGQDTDRQDTPHVPVMRDEVVAALAPRDGEIHVDGTFGAGGYSRALLDAADTRVWGIDRDPEAVARGRALERSYGGRFAMIEGRFGTMDRLLGARGVDGVDGVALDVGVSSMQIDDAERGFSFQHDGPLDMRMERAGESAADVVNDRDERSLADILFRYGEEPKARRIARAIVAARADAPITRTGRLADVVGRAAGPSRKGVNPATRTFQALRIYVNDELGELEAGLCAAERLLLPEGRLAVVSFHSLEDRIVKTFMARRSGRTPAGSRHTPPPIGGEPAPSFRLPARRAVKPSEAEVDANPRARSARLRVAVRTADAPWAGPATVAGRA